jgi:sec-independent protein translocase protein TatA
MSTFRGRDNERNVMPGFVGFPELLLLGLVVLLVFGPKRLPEMGRSMGKGLREFKESVTHDKHEADLALPGQLSAEDASSLPLDFPRVETKRVA